MADLPLEEKPLDPDVNLILVTLAAGSTEKGCTEEAAHRSARAVARIEARALEAEAEVTAQRERAEQAEAALAGLDDPIAWMAEHYPKAVDEMPTEYFARIRAAGNVLKEGQ